MPNFYDDIYAKGQKVATEDYVNSSSSGSVDVVDVYKKTLQSNALAEAEINNYQYIVLDLFVDDTEFSLDGSAVYNTSEDTISGSGSVISTSESIVSSSSATIYAMVIPVEVLNSGSITYYLSRNGGADYQTVTKNVNTLITGTGDSMRIKAVISGNAKLLGWAYLIKEGV